MASGASLNKRPVRKAVFPVGGLGTRFLPATKAMPKEMLPIIDKPIIQYALEEAQAAGIEEFIFVTGRGKSAIEDHFDRSEELLQQLRGKGKTAEIEDMESWVPGPGQVVYTRQQEPLGLGHAVWCARHLVGDEPFAVLLADDLVQSDTPCLKQMTDIYNDTGGNLIAVEEVPREQTSRYGVLDPGEDDGTLVTVKGMVEKPDPADAPSNLAVIGRYILMPQVMDALGHVGKGRGGEIQLTDAIAATLADVPLRGYRFDGRRFDCGSKVGFIQANIAFALGRDDLARDVGDYIQEIAAGL
jgi:UTP--glucose-1-phosphate uridylyltransferase